MTSVRPIALADLQSLLDESDRAVLVKLWRPHCAFCPAIAPAVERIAERYADRLRVVAINTSEVPGTEQRLGLPGVPALILYVDGREATRVLGARPEAAIVEAIEPHLGEPVSVSEPRLRRRSA